MRFPVAISEFDDSPVFGEFGSWMDLEHGVFDSEWLAQRIGETLERTGGHLEMGYQLESCMEQLARDAKYEALRIAQLFLLEGKVRGGGGGAFYLMLDEWVRAFTVLVEDRDTADRARKLIDDLIREGGRVFWPLREISG